MYKRFFASHSRAQTSIVRNFVFWAILIAILASVTVLAAIDRWVSVQTKEQLLTDPQTIELFDVAVVLGTSKYLGKVLNDYYINRMDAAIALYKMAKIKRFLLSGDNAHPSYNEPWVMKRDLLDAGIPKEIIHLDYAGFRTLDSIIRTKEIFETDNFLIISQKFHCERALFIANFHHIRAMCFVVDGPKAHSGYEIRLREVFARTKAFIDLYLLNTKPKFLGPKEPLQSPL